MTRSKGYSATSGWEGLRHDAVERRLVSVDGDGWSVLRLSRKDRGLPERLDRKDWCGAFRATASHIEKTTYLRRMKASGRIPDIG